MSGSLLKGALYASMATLLAACVQTPSRPPDSGVPGIFFDDPKLFEFDDRTTLRQVSDDALNVTKSFEQFRGSLYNDPVKFCTIAYGHLVVRQPCGPPEVARYPTPLSEPQGVEILGKDMHFAEIAVANSVTAELTDEQFGALCDFVFNVGAGNFKQSRLLELVNQGALEEVAAEFRRWRRAGGKILAGLVRRREAEIALFYRGLDLDRTSVEASTERADIDVYTGQEIR